MKEFSVILKADLKWNVLNPLQVVCYFFMKIVWNILIKEWCHNIVEALINILEFFQIFLRALNNKEN